MRSSAITLASSLLPTSSRFASIYDAEEDKYRSEMELMDLGSRKRSCRMGHVRRLRRTSRGFLACLSVRFALNFNMDRTAGDIARTQVERHMGLCLTTTTGCDTLITLTGSEPLLAEAAYEVMKGSQSNPVRHLANRLDLNCVDRGYRGELGVALLIMQACGAARLASSGRRWASIDAFMEELLQPAEYDILKESFPTFKDHGIWFNHFIKVEKEKVSILPYQSVTRKKLSRASL